MLADFERLTAVLEALPGQRAAIAYSGGVDSTTLARAAEIALGRENVLLLYADSVFAASDERKFALEYAASRRWQCEVVPVEPLQIPEIAANPVNRCYYCKKMFFAALLKQAQNAGFPVLCDGQNLDDADDFRPGAKAAAELGVRHPLEDAQMDKAAIRDLAHDFSLPNSQAPAAACLASRIPAGTPVTPEALTRIDQAESALHKLGFAAVRVRDYGKLGKIEVEPALLENLFRMRGRVHKTLLAAGYEAAALDLNGYRRGAVNGVNQK